MAGNPFDQFDTQSVSQGSAKPANPFDQFDTHSTADQPNFANRAAGIVARGASEGVSGLFDAAQAARGWVSKHTVPALGAGSDYRITPRLQAALDQAGAYQPHDASGKIAEGAVAGLTGSLVTGGTGLLPAVSGSLAGAAAPAVKAMGGSDGAAAVASLAAGLSPAGLALRGAAGNAARNYAAKQSAKTMTDDEAVDTIRAHNAIMAANGGSLTPSASTTFQAAGTAKKDLANVLKQYSTAARDTGAVSKDALGDLGTALSQANAHTNALSDFDGSAYGNLAYPGVLPDGHIAPVQSALRTLNTLSPQQFKNASAGPMATLAAKAAPLASIGTGLAAAAGGNHGMLLDALEGNLVGGLASKTIPTLGRAADRVLGTAVTPAEARISGALMRAKQNGLDTSGDPLTDLRALTGELRGQPNGPYANSLFESSGGQLGSPAAPEAPPGMTSMGSGFTEGQSSPPPQQTPPGTSTAPPPQQTPPGTSTAPQQPSQSSSPPGPVWPPAPDGTALVGGHKLVAMKMADYGHAPPTPQEVADAATSFGKEGALGDGLVAHITGGGPVPQTWASAISRRILQNRGLDDALNQFIQTNGDTFSQASDEVSNLMGGQSAIPNGGPRGPVLNAYRWQGSAQNARNHAADLMSMAPPEQRPYISEISATPKSADKMAILERYRTKYPDASLDLFTPTLMKGID